jgi:hypothetical protein
MMKTQLLSALLFLGASAHASTLTYSTTLSGAGEVPPTGSTATGTASFIVDLSAQTIEVIVSFSGLSSPDNGAHIHCCVPLGSNTGVATAVPSFAGFPLGVTSGTVDLTYNLTDIATYNPAFISSNGSLANAEAALLAGMAAGQTYFNIHTSINPGGEIRGQLALVAPEPATWSLVSLAFAALALQFKRRALNR